METFMAGILVSVADLAVCLLPLPAIYELQLPLSQRISTAALLGLGGIATIAGTVRTVYIYIALVASWDVTWEGYPLWIWGSIELHLAMVSCAHDLTSTEVAVLILLRRSVLAHPASGRCLSKPAIKSQCICLRRRTLVQPL